MAREPLSKFGAEGRLVQRAARAAFETAKARAARQPFNPQLHAELLAKGYVFTPMEAEFDDGDPENGPGQDGSPPYDEYQGPDEYVFVDEDGTAHHEARDHELEAWIDQMASSGQL